LNSHKLSTINPGLIGLLVFVILNLPLSLADASDSLIVLSGKARESRQKFWKSANFKHLINGVALGDVDGDGKIETVAITPHAVIIYRFEAGRFRTIRKISETYNKNLIGVDIADINGNGYAEIFVTSLNANKNMLVSFVLEFDGKNIAKIVDDSPGYYRVAEDPGRGKILLGQRPRLGNPNSGKINKMTWQNSEYVRRAQINTPRHTNLLGFTLGDVLNSGQETAVTYSPNDHIRVVDSSGNVLWNSPDRHGGSMLYYRGPIEDRGDVENKIYFPLRLLVRKDRVKKESEVIAVKNYDVTGRKLEFRKFTKSHIEAFTWSANGLAPSWQTRSVSGYIQDFAIGDFDNDGQDELIGAVIIKEGRVVLITEPESTIIAYELNIPHRMPNVE